MMIKHESMRTKHLTLTQLVELQRERFQDLKRIPVKRCTRL